MKLFDRAIWLLLKFGRTAYDGFTFELTGTKTQPHHCFPASHRELAEKLLSCAGSIRMIQIEPQLSKDSLTVLDRVNRDTYDAGEQITLRDVREHAKLMADDFKARVLNQRGNEISVQLANKSITAEDAAKVMRNTISELESIGHHMSSRYAKDIAAKTRQEVEAVAAGKKRLTLRTGFSILDGIGFLRCAEVAGIAGESKQGKTQEAMQIAHSVAEGGQAVVIFSMEMPQEVLFRRLAASRAKFDLTKLDEDKIDTNEPAYKRFLEEIDKLGKLPLIVDARSGLSATQMQEVIDFHSDELGGIALIVLDYARLAKADERTYSESSQVEAIFKEFKNLVKNHVNPDGSNPAGLVITELNRNKDGGAIPARKNLKFAGDYVLSCCIAPFNPMDYESDMGVKSFWEKTGEHRPLERWMVVIFNRHGKRAGILRGFRFIEEYTRWEQGSWE